MNHRVIPVALASLFTIVTGCESAKVQGPEEPTLAISSRAAVKMKNHLQYGAHLSQALGLERNELCRELGRYDCLDQVHFTSLGGVEPDFKGVFEPVDKVTGTTALALDRVALSACRKRAALDLGSNNSGLIFTDLSLTSTEALQNPRGQAVIASATRLVERVHGRSAAEHEVEALVALYDEVLAEGPIQAAQHWATLACFSVTTMAEAIFY